MTSPNDQYQHNRIESTALPYISNASVIESRPHWVSGSNNTLASIRGWTERRPGFSTYTSDDLSASTGKIDRFFTWQRWDGSFYIMLSVSLATASPVRSRVYKLKVGTDATFVSLFDSSAVSTEPFDFVEANNFVFFGNGTAADMKKYDGTTVTNWGITAPASAPSAANAGAGNVPATTGHYYVYAYGVSATGYLSDISSRSTRITTASRTWTVTGPFCPDTQCDKVHIYRTEDGGSSYLELSNSPVNNPGSGSFTITDNDADTSLQQSLPAPLPGVNGKPPGLKGFRFWAGRIWGFNDDYLAMSTFEECTSSVPEECWGTALTNRRPQGGQVFAIGKTKDFILTHSSKGITRLAGDSLDTFTQSLLSSNMGARNRAAVADYDDKCAWLDYSNTIQVSDGYTIAKDDISLPIQPDIESIVHATASLTIYSTGRYKWLVLCDGGAAKLRVFDLRLNQWNPPWAITGAEAIGTGQTAAGAVKLFLSISAKPMTVNHSNYQDNASTYIAELYSNLLPVNKDNPVSVGVLKQVGVERNSVALTDVKYLSDEDPASGSYVSIFTNERDPDNRTAGTGLVEKWYLANVSAQRFSAYLKWAAANSKFVLYSLNLPYRKEN